MSIVSWLDRTFFPLQGDNWDNKLFRDLVLRRLDSDKLLLDVGAGAGIVQEMNFRAIARQVIGIDPDERVLSNPYLDVAHVGFGDAMPMIPDASVDVAVSCNVLEHLTDPQSFFREVHRVLVPGGVFITKTPNRLHYVPLIARITPDSFHKLINKLRGRNEVDTFPTRYLVNTRCDQSYYAKNAGFLLDSMDFYEGRPEYLRMHCLTYGVGIFYERCVNALGIDSLKVIIVSIFRKPPLY